MRKKGPRGAHSAFDIKTRRVPLSRNAHRAYPPPTFTLWSYTVISLGHPWYPSRSCLTGFVAFLFAFWRGLGADRSLTLTCTLAIATIATVVPQNFTPGTRARFRTSVIERRPHPTDSARRLSGRFCLTSAGYPNTRNLSACPCHPNMSASNVIGERVHSCVTGSLSDW